MKGRKIINLLSIGIIGGLLVGFSISVYYCINNQHIQNGMLRLVAFEFQRYLNQWIILGIIILLPIFITASLEKNRLKILLVCLICFIFFSLTIWAANYYWLPPKFHPISLLADAGILFFTLFYGWILLNVKGETLYKLDKIKYIRRIAVTLFISLLLLNIGVIINAKLNIPKGPNVILISIDTLRADHLGCYGYKIKTSPYIDSFAEKSVLFTNARSQSHWTTPSHLSLFTSLYPSIFKVWNYPDPGRLHNRYITLAEILRNQGYVTAAFTAGGFVHKSYGFNQGFDIYMDEIAHSDIATIFNKFGLKWIKRQKSKFMVFLHCYEPHAPYNPPVKFKKEFASKYTPLSQINGAHYWVGSDNDIGKKTEKWFKDTKDMNFLKTVIGLYDGEIRYVDSEIEKLFNELKTIGIFDNSLVIFLSDHGEAFNEHNSFSHGNLYDEILRVPLIIHFPKSVKQYNMKSINDVVGLIDVLPTILDVCQIPYSPDEFQGTSLLSLIEHRGHFPREYSFSEQPRCKAIATLESKYKNCTYKGNQQEEFYDIAKDPGETYDLLQTELTTANIKEKYLKIKEDLAAQTNKNESIMANISGGDTSVKKIGLDEKTKKRLKSLGYIK